MIERGFHRLDGFSQNKIYLFKSVAKLRHPCTIFLPPVGFGFLFIIFKLIETQRIFKI